MATVGVLRYAAFHHVEHGLTDGRVHHLHHTSHHVACSQKRKEYTFWRQFNKKPRIIPSCPK